MAPASHVGARLLTARAKPFRAVAGVIYMNIDGRIITPDNFYALYVEGVAPFCAGPPAAVAPGTQPARAFVRALGAS